ncbi:MAG TPA: hypothetical protein DCS19_07900 [Flavobacterium sp.]|nr:hypothetical protein [Flavobacterium sp.]
MSKNMTDSIERVIEKVKNAVDDKRIKQKKYTIDGNSTSKQWLQHLKIEEQVRLFPDFYSAWLTYQNNNYLVLVNYKFQTIPHFLQEENLNSGAWTAIIHELDIDLKKDTDISKNLLEELLESEWEINSRGYKVVNFEKDINGEINEEINGFTLKYCFPSISFYKIINKFNQKEELRKITGIALTQSNSYRLLPYTDDVLKEFKEIFENGNKYIPFDNILASYVASDFKFAYLDLYRCIERLQPLYYFKNFYNKLGLSDKSLQDFCHDFYDTTKLEPRPNDSLNELLQSIDIKKICQYNKNKGKSFASYLNQLRNQIVHLRPKQINDLVPQSIPDWNCLMLDMLKIVKELYKTNEQLLTSGSSNQQSTENND